MLLGHYGFQSQPHNHIAECGLLKFKCTKQAEISNMHTKSPS